MRMSEAVARTGPMAADPSLFALLDALADVARGMHPSRLGDLAASVQPLAQAVRSAGRDRFGAPVQPAADLALQACDGLQAAAVGQQPVRDAYRAMRSYSHALDALIAAEQLPEVSRHLLPADLRGNACVLNRLQAPPHPQSGVRHSANDTRQRGGFSVYVPPWYDPARLWPVVMALHGGAGHGRLFLTNWVPRARAQGVIVIAPTAIGDTATEDRSAILSGNGGDTTRWP